MQRTPAYRFECIGRIYIVFPSSESVCLLLEWEYFIGRRGLSDQTLV